MIQRIKHGCVRVDGICKGTCKEGLCILLGVACGDTEADAERLSHKILQLRIFSDEVGKMNRSVMDIGGEVLLVSNFTLLGSYKKGNRPDYMNAASPAEAERLYQYFGSLCEKELKHVGYGVFGAHMEIDLSCDGPVTMTLDSRILQPSAQNK